MSFENNMIGKKIIIKKDSKKRDERYTSQILDIIDDNTYIISGPIKKKNIVAFHVDETIEISYVVEDKGRFYFKAKIMERVFEDIYTLKVFRITAINKLQERNFYRLNISLDIIKSCYKKTQLGIKTIDEECKSVDLSGGGIQLRCNYLHSIGDSVNVLLTIDNFKIALDGEVVRINSNDTYGYKYLIGIKFINITSKDRDEIVRYIFDEQRRLRKKRIDLNDSKSISSR